MSIGERIYEILNVRGLSIRQLSDQTELPYRTLQNYLHGTRPPSSEALVRICQRTGVDANWLLLGEGPMERGYAMGAGRPSVARDGGEDVYLAGEAQRLSRHLLAELQLGQARIAAMQAAQPRMWKLIRIFHERHPQPVPVDTLTTEMLEHHGLSAEEVTASLSLLLTSGLIRGDGDPNRPAYRLSPGLAEVQFRDMHEVLAGVISALEELAGVLVPALKERRGKLVTAKVQVKQGTGRQVIRDILAMVRRRFEALDLAGDDADQLSVVIGLAVDEAEVLDEDAALEEGLAESL